MYIDFKALEQALSPIEKIGQGELTFDAGGVSITIRVLLPAEELDVQRHAGAAFNSDDGEDDSSSAVEYLDRFRTATLSYAVIEASGQNFRDVDFVETDEVLEKNGHRIKIAKHLAMRQLIARWPRSVTTRCFHKYSELLRTVEANAEKAIEYTPSDHEAEIERLESRLKELKAVKEREQRGNQEAFSARVQAVATIGVPDEDAPKPRLKPEPVETLPPEPVETPQPVRRSGPISPSVAAPPMPPTPSTTARPQSPDNSPSPESSFVNMDDGDAMGQAMEREHQRIAEMRRRHIEGRPPLEEGSALGQSVRQPYVGDDVNAVARHVGEIDGKPVFAMPSQDLGTPSQKQNPQPVLNPTSESGGSRNPRFTRLERP